MASGTGRAQTRRRTEGLAPWTASRQTPGSTGRNDLSDPDLDWQTADVAFSCQLQAIRRVESSPTEAMAVAEYIAGEMNQNSACDYSLLIRHFNSQRPDQCLEDVQQNSGWGKILAAANAASCVRRGMTSSAAALALWTWKVRQGGEWDHKTAISRIPDSSSTRQYHRLGAFAYYYDVWSNIHYGYVGAACRFGEGLLLDGAGLEQAGSSLAAGRLPERIADLPIPRAWDDKPDQAGIQIGITLYRESPHGVTAQQLVKAVVASADVNRRPISS